MGGHVLEKGTTQFLVVDPVCAREQCSVGEAQKVVAAWIAPGLRHAVAGQVGRGSPERSTGVRHVFEYALDLIDTRLRPAELSLKQVDFGQVGKKHDGR